MPFNYTQLKKEDVGNNNFIVTSGYNGLAGIGVFARIHVRIEQKVDNVLRAYEMFPCEFYIMSATTVNLSAMNFITLNTMAFGDGMVQIVRGAQIPVGVILNTYVIRDEPQQPKSIVAMNAFFTWGATLSGTDIIVP